MANLDNLLCATNIQNVGFGQCYLDIKTVRGCFLVPTGYAITDAQLASLSTKLQLDAYADAKAGRIFPIHNFVNITPNKEDLIVEKFGYGAGAPVREGFADWMFQFTVGGLSLLQALRSFNGAGYAVIFYDARGILFGINQNGSMAGIPLQFFWADTWSPSDGSKYAVYMTRFNFDTKYINDQLAWYQVDTTAFDLGSVKGLQSILLTQPTAYNGTTHIITVAWNTKIGNTNLYDLFTSVVTNKVNYTLVNKETGAAITITSATGNAVAKTVALLVDSTDTDYPVSTKQMTLGLVAPSVLNAASMIGYEGISIDITIP